MPKKQTKKVVPRQANIKRVVSKKTPKLTHNAGLLAIAKSIQPKPHENWLSLVTPQQRADIIETCQAIISGEMTGSIRAIADAWQAHGIDCSRNKLTDLVAKVRRGEVQ